MPQRRPYFQSLSKTLADTTAEYVEGQRVDPRETLFITTGSIEDETNAPTTIGFGKKIGTRFEAFEELESPSVGIRYHIDKTHRFDAGDVPAFRVEGGTLNDKLSGHLEGYVEEV